MGDGRGGTYKFVDVPTAVLAFALGFLHALAYPEVPVHVSSFLLLAFFVCGETSTTLCT